MIILIGICELAWDQLPFYIFQLFPVFGISHLEPNF